MKSKNNTDLHIEFKLDTGNQHSWESGFETTLKYKHGYAEWLEDKYLSLINKQIDQYVRISEFEDAMSELSEMRDEVDYLENALENQNS